MMITEEGIKKLVDQANDSPEFLPDMIINYVGYIIANEIQHDEKHLDIIKNICKSWKNHSELTEGISILSSGFHSFYMGLFVAAKKNFENALQVINKYSLGDLQAITYVHLGITYRTLGELDKAVNCFFLTPKVVESKDHLVRLISHNYYQLAEIHIQINDLEAAKEYYTLSYEMVNELNIPSATFRPLLGLGSLSMAEEKYDESKKYLEEAYQITNIDEVKRSKVLCDLGVLEHHKNNLHKALELLWESREIRKKNQLSDAESTCLIEISKILLKQNKLDEALKICEEALKLTLANNSTIKKTQCFKILSEIYEAQAEFKKAYTALKEYNFLEDKQQSIKFKNIYKLKNKVITDQKDTIKNVYDEITDSIKYAKKLQEAILPSKNSFKSYFDDSFVYFKPKDIVSGDFYWLIEKENTIYIAAADCTGHGVPGAMVSFVCANALEKSVKELGCKNPSEILNETRKLVIETFAKAGSEIKDGMDISLTAIHDNNSKSVSWAGANNSLWIIRKGAKEVEEIKADKQPIGNYAHQKPFTAHNVKFNKGDCFYLFTDGFQDQFGGERGKKFKPANFKKLLLSICSEQMDKQLEIIDSAFKNWKGDLEQVDDVCVIGVRL